jgi:hypothetical protein
MVFIDRRTSKIDNMIMARMFADTPAELDAMADRVGLERAWKLQADTAIEHYLLTTNKRAMAVRHGAVVMDTELCIERLRRRGEGIQEDAGQVPDGWTRAREGFAAMQEVMRVAEQAAGAVGVQAAAEQWVAGMRRVVNQVAHSYGIRRVH